MSCSCTYVVYTGIHTGVRYAVFLLTYEYCVQLHVHERVHVLVLIYEYDSCIGNSKVPTQPRCTVISIDVRHYDYYLCTRRQYSCKLYARVGRIVVFWYSNIRCKNYSNIRTIRIVSVHYI